MASPHRSTSPRRRAAVAALAASVLALVPVAWASAATTPPPTSPTPTTTATATTTETATATATATTTITATTTASPSTSPSPSPSLTAPPPPAETVGAPWWVWLGAGALVLLGALGIIAFIVSGRRRRTEPWDHELARQASDVRWFSDSVAIAVADRTRSPDEAAALWRADLTAVLSTEQVLDRLAGTAPDPAREGTAARLRDATTALRGAVDADLRLRLGEAAAGQEVLLTQSAQVIAARRQDVAESLAAADVAIAPTRHR